MPKKHPTIRIDELMQRVAKEEQHAEAVKRGEAPGVDQVREARMQALREKYPEGLRAVPRPRKGRQAATPKWENFH